MSEAVINRESAIKLSESGFWESMTPRDIAAFQLQTELLCMPFDVFHEAMEKAIGRPVWTHEFAFPDLLRAELFGEKGPPTMDEIFALIPDDKIVIPVVSPD